jgi:hypothetical protein
MADKTTTAISEFMGQPVDTWSEEWRHECEVHAVLAMTKERRIRLTGSLGAGSSRYRA